MMDRRIIYLDNAATSWPKPPGVAAAITECMANAGGNPGRGSHTLAKRAAERIYDCREALAELLHCEPEQVAFTYNTTYALNMAIKGALASFPGDIAISDIEHNSVRRPALAAAREHRMRLRVFRASEDEGELEAELRRVLDRGVTVLACTHASNVCSLAMPAELIGRLCAERGVFFILDAAQSAGSLEIDIEKMNISALAAPGHKGLYGPQGCGVLAVRQETPLRTLLEGGGGINSRDDYMPDFMPERFEAGTLAVPAIAGLAEGVRWVRRVTPSRIHAHETALCERFYKRISRDDRVKTYKLGSGGTLMINIDSYDSESAAAALDERYGICVRAGLHCSPMGHSRLGTPESGAVRFSFGAMNTERDADAAAAAVLALASEKPAKRK